MLGAKFTLLYWTVNPVLLYIVASMYSFTEKQHDCRNILFEYSIHSVDFSTLCGIIYSVMLSAIAEPHERRGVLWALAISDFGNFSLIKT